MIDLDDEDARIGVRDGRFVSNPGHETHPVTETTWAAPSLIAVGGVHDCRPRWNGRRPRAGLSGRPFPWGDAMPTQDLAVIGLPSGTTVAVGSRPKGATPEGLMDMGGSLLEWTSTLDRPYPYRANDGREDLRHRASGSCAAATTFSTIRRTSSLRGTVRLPGGTPQRDIARSVSGAPAMSEAARAALDHIAVVAPDLASGLAWVREMLGVEPQPGGKHPEMGTHNHLLRLGDSMFLEVIAADPAAGKPSPHRRWFGLDDPAQLRRDWRDGRRLRGWVARCTDLEATIGPRGPTFGVPMPISRGDRRWKFSVRADGTLPADGALPHLIDWGEAGPPASAMPDKGCRLSAFVIETPDPAFVRSSLSALTLSDEPDIRDGKVVRLIAAIETPRGVRILT